jgi:hypothetical protein
VAFLPSKMRTFWNSVVPPSTEGACCAGLTWQSPIESTAATASEKHDARFDERIVRVLDEALKVIPEFIRACSLCLVRSGVQLKRLDLRNCGGVRRRRSTGVNCTAIDLGLKHAM